jgi:hypothetical protein
MAPLDLISLQDIYDVNALDLMKLGKSFGFSEPPHVPLDLTGTKRKKVKMDKAHKRWPDPNAWVCFLIDDARHRHGISEDSPYGKRSKTSEDGRQWQ